MPRVFKIGGYIVYFWVNENDPLKTVSKADQLQTNYIQYGKMKSNRNGRCRDDQQKLLLPLFGKGSFFFKAFSK